MERKAVSSSNIRSIGYDSDSSVLEIEFNDGSLYQYSNVPQSEYDGIMGATSHGTYFNAHIKRVYPFAKV